MTDPNGLVTGYGYDANGNRASLTYPNDTETTYTYDNLNRLENLKTMGSSGIIQSYQYTLGPVGNRTKIEEADGTVREYDYDDLYRLTEEKVSDPTDLVYQKSFLYDDVGNRLNQTTTGLGASALDYGYDNRDWLLTENSTGYGWDYDGNLTSKPGEAEYFWDFENRLVRVLKTDSTVVTHEYDADGNRVRTEATLPQVWRFVKPDIVNHGAGFYLEVKPLSISGIGGAALQMAAYFAALAPLGYVPDIRWQPNPPVRRIRGRRLRLSISAACSFIRTPPGSIRN